MTAPPSRRDGWRIIVDLDTNPNHGLRCEPAPALRAARGSVVVSPPTMMRQPSRRLGGAVMSILGGAGEKREGGKVKRPRKIAPWSPVPPYRARSQFACTGSFPTPPTAHSSPGPPISVVLTTAVQRY